MSKGTKLIEAPKHIAIYNDFIMKKVEQGDIVPQYVPTEEHVADILTK